MHIENLPRAEEAQAFQNTCTDVLHCFSVAIPMHFLHSVPLFYASHLLPCLSHLAVLLCPKAQEFWGCTRMILLSISGSFMALGCCVKEHSASDPTKCCGVFFEKSIEAFLLDLEIVLHCFSIPACPNIVPAIIYWSELASWSPDCNQGKDDSEVNYSMNVNCIFSIKVPLFWLVQMIKLLMCCNWL